jgi:hypothetical protein
MPNSLLFYAVYLQERIMKNSSLLLDGNYSHINNLTDRKPPSVSLSITSLLGEDASGSGICHQPAQCGLFWHVQL